MALDLLFVCALSLYTHSAASRTTFEGALEHADAGGARGWAVDLERPGAPVEVQVFGDGRFVAAGFADEPRPDSAAGAPSGGGRLGFSFVFEPGLSGDEEVRVYAVRVWRGGSRRTLQQIGGPVRLGQK